MIKNVVFDIGGVLVDFRWRELMTELGMSVELQDRFARTVFGSRWWETLDHGTLEESEAIANIRKDNEQYLKEFDILWEHQVEMIKAFDYSVNWIQDLKKRGYNVYLLSNYPKNLFTLHEENGLFTFLPLVDGKVVSAFEKLIKPDADIYQCLMNRYNLNPEECVFIDDRPENAEGARKVGMNAIQFVSYEQASADLEKLLKY